MDKKWVIHSEEEMHRLGQEIANSHLSPFIALTGDLGTGKTSLCRAIIRDLMNDPDLIVPSPTYNLVQIYDLPDGRSVWHFDLYRLEDEQQLYDIGWEDALSDDVICLVEWPDKMRGLAPAAYTQITIETNPDKSREVTIKT